MVTKFLSPNKPWSCKYSRKQRKECKTFQCMILLRNKTVAHTILHIVPQSKWQSLSRKSVKIQKLCSYGNLTAHLSSLLNTLVKEVDGKERKRLSPSHRPFCWGAVLVSCDCSVTAYDRGRQETTENESAGTDEYKDVTFKLLNKKINLVPVDLCVLF